MQSHYYTPLGCLPDTKPALIPFSWAGCSNRANEKKRKKSEERNEGKRTKGKWEESNWSLDHPSSSSHLSRLSFQVLILSSLPQLVSLLALLMLFLLFVVSLNLPQILQWKNRIKDIQTGLWSYGFNFGFSSLGKQDWRNRKTPLGCLGNTDNTRGVQEKFTECCQRILWSLSGKERRDKIFNTCLTSFLLIKACILFVLVPVVEEQRETSSSCRQFFTESDVLQERERKCLYKHVMCILDLASIF